MAKSASNSVGTGSRAEDAGARIRAFAAKGTFPSQAKPEAGDESKSALTIAAWHSLGWLYVANLIGVWLAILLLFPAAGRWLGEWSYGRWTPVHLNFQLYGWMALPLVGWAIRINRADRGPIAEWSRAALVLWSTAL